MDTLIRKLKLPALIVAVLLAIYAVAGFFVVPAVVKSKAISFLKETYGLELGIKKLSFNPFTFVARLDHASLETADGDRLFALEGFAANFELRSLFKRALVFKSIELARPYVHIHLLQDGSLNLSRTFVEKTKAPEEQRGKGMTPIIIDDLIVSGGDVQFTDNTGGRDFDQHLTELALHVEHFSTRPKDGEADAGLAVDLGDKGRLKLVGDLSAIPVRFDVKVAAESIPLALFQPYMPAALQAEISGGALGFDLAVKRGQPEQTSKLAVNGQATVTGLALKVKERNDLAVAWDRVTASGIDFQLAPDQLKIDEVAVQGLDTSFKIYSDGRTNVGEVWRRAAGRHETEEQPAAASEPFPYAIGRISIADSRLMYSDELIKPNVHVQIDQLAGEASGIGSDPQAQTALKLAGRVGAHGKADIDGAFRLPAPKTDLKATVVFSNIELTAFSPYAGKFAGYTIDKGKLFLDLRYTLVNSRIKGVNHAVFDQFELGDKVESEEATHLPVKLALSLLRDRDGRIDISLPVEGNVDSPGFKLGPLIVKALINLIERIVTAPFDFIAGLFGGGPDMEYAVFEPGSGTLSAAEHDKILPLSKALAERPRLIVEVQGWAETAADGAALRQAKLDALLEKAASKAKPDAVLAAVYDASFGSGAADALRKQMKEEAKRQTQEGGKPAVEPGAVEARMRDKLLAAQPVSDDELTGLAYQRGQQVMDALVRDGGVEAERIFVRRGEIAQAGEGTRAKLILDAR